jgi:hypothetical protein
MPMGHREHSHELVGQLRAGAKELRAECAQSHEVVHQSRELLVTIAQQITTPFFVVIVPSTAADEGDA